MVKAFHFHRGDVEGLEDDDLRAPAGAVCLPKPPIAAPAAAFLTAMETVDRCLELAMESCDIVYRIRRNIGHGGGEALSCRATIKDMFALYRPVLLGARKEKTLDSMTIWEIWCRSDVDGTKAFVAGYLEADTNKSPGPVIDAAQKKLDEAESMRTVLFVHDTGVGLLK